MFKNKYYDFQTKRFDEISYQIKDLYNEYIFYWLELNRIPKSGSVAKVKNGDSEEERQEIIEKWMNEPSPTLGFSDSDNNEKYYTKKGMRVRTEMHKFLADIFDEHGIAYKYERPKFLRDGTVVYPAFTLMNTYLYYETYWDVFQFGYKPNDYDVTLEKMAIYLTNGILDGRNLISTFDVHGYEVDEDLILDSIDIYLKQSSMII